MRIFYTNPWKNDDSEKAVGRERSLEVHDYQLFRFTIFVIYTF